MKKKRSENPGQKTRIPASEAPEIIPVVDEVLEVGKSTVQTGRTRISKRVHEREEEIDQPLLKQKVEVERVPINRFVEAALPVREQDGTTIVPVLEEVLVVEKRLLLKEELHIRTVSETVRNPQKVMLRSEEVEVEHFDTPEQMEKHRH